MKIRGKIIQIIKNKDFKSYFSWKTVLKLDAINIGPIDENKPTTLIDSISNGLKKVFYGSEWSHVYFHMPHAVECPHNFKKGDIVEIEVNIRKIADTKNQRS